MNPLLRTDCLGHCQIAWRCDECKVCVEISSQHTIENYVWLVQCWADLGWPNSVWLGPDKLADGVGLAVGLQNKPLVCFKLFERRKVSAKSLDRTQPFSAFSLKRSRESSCAMSAVGATQTLSVKRRKVRAKSLDRTLPFSASPLKRSRVLLFHVSTGRDSDTFRKEAKGQCQIA